MRKFRGGDLFVNEFWSQNALAPQITWCLDSQNARVQILLSFEILN
jgi:hypothetical protein